MSARWDYCWIVWSLLIAIGAGQEPLASPALTDDVWSAVDGPHLEAVDSPPKNVAPFSLSAGGTALLERSAEQLESGIKSIIDPWEGSMELGLNGVSGNADMFNLWWGGMAKHHGQWMTETGWGVWILNHDRGGQGVNTLMKDGRLDAPLGAGRWNWFLHGFLEYDETRAFDDRLSADTGLGYTLLDTPESMAVARSGLAGSQEFGGLADGFHSEIYLGGALEQRLAALHRLLFTVDYYPDVVRFSDYRLNSTASWQMLLVQEWNLHLKLSVIDRYDSTPHSPHRNDLAYSTLLLWAF